MTTPIQALKSKEIEVSMNTYKGWLKWNVREKEWQVFMYAKSRVVCRTNDIDTAVDFLLGKR